MFQVEKLKEMPFGKWRLEITVRGIIYNEQYGSDILNVVSKVNVIQEDSILIKSSSAETYDYPNAHPNYQAYIIDVYKHYNLDTEKAYTFIKGNGKVAIVEGLVGKEINDIRCQFEAEIEEAYREYRGLPSATTIAERHAEEDLEIARSIIAKANELGVENLPNEAEARERRKHYNNLFNEGGDGYVPPILTREAYERAIAKVKQFGGI